MMPLKALARALGGEVSGRTALCPGPGHSRKDRSLQVSLSPTAPDGFVVRSFAGDDFAVCRDYVRGALGLVAFRPRREPSRQAPPVRRAQPSHDSDESRQRVALAIWRQTKDLRGTLGDIYLTRDRELNCGEDFSAFLRWYERDRTLVGLFRDIATNEPRAITRIFLDAEGHKIERKFLGPVGDCAIKIDDDENVTMGLIVGEGLETCVAARQLGYAPVWALGSAGAIGKFPVLNGVEGLTILAEEGVTSRKEVQACFDRWRAAGRDIVVRKSTVGSDINDAIKNGPRV